MTTTIGSYVVELKQSKQRGMTWVVRLHKKTLLFRKLISSDWFLEEKQARTFLKQLQEQLSTNSAVDILKKRKPGWTLLRASH